MSAKGDQESDGDIVERVPTTPALVSCFLLGATAFVILALSLAILIPTWLFYVAAFALVAGMVLMGVLAAREAKRNGRSVLRIVGSTIWTPIRFFFNWTF